MKIVNVRETESKKAFDQHNYKKLYIRSKKIKLWKHCKKNIELRKRLKMEKLNPCNHHKYKLVDDCLYCFSKSFASDPKSDYCHIKNKESPEKLTKGSNKLLVFNCNICFHKYNSRPDRASIRGGGCPYCSSKKLCGDNCEKCYIKSFVSSKKIYFWDWNKNYESPWLVFKCANKKYWFLCGECCHSFDISPHEISKTRWCPYCAHSKLCIEDCKLCYDKSFESEEKAKYWDLDRNELLPKEVFKCTNKKYWFLCGECRHSFNASANSITKGTWCPYCSNSRLCDKECKLCYNKSFATNKMAKYWNYNKNKLSPRQVFSQASKKYWFGCPVCYHSFSMRVSDIFYGHWCNYCSNTIICKNECKICYKKSFASSHKANCWDYRKNKLTPREVFKNSGKLVWLNCDICTHPLYVKPNNVSNGIWCRFCRGQVCGKEDCKLCDEVCEACLTNKARMKTRIKKLNLCKICFTRNIKDNPDEAPLKSRSKITLEICTLIELHIQCEKEDDSFLIAEPTSWDCAILPGSDRKPDNIWVVDNRGNVLVVSGACKINSGDVSYVLILEVLEHSIKRHSKQREISDEDREEEIRGIFAHIPVGFVYVTVAHTKHIAANKKDVFFEKNSDGEYEVLENRQAAFEKRIGLVRDKLIQFYVNKSNESYWIGN
jgi:hypothetical protein